MVTYSIVVCNLDMAETVESSLRSILDKTGGRYEVLVVDGGSTDGSLRILRRLSEEYDRLRVICSANTAANTLGADRNIGVREANGEHVLVQMDADDAFEPVIDDFIAIYEELRRHRETDFYLSGSGINVAPRDFLLSYGPYREGIDRGEDSDMWRRMLADDALVQLSHETVCEPIGYEPTRGAFVRQRLSEIEGDLLSGVSPWSRARESIENRPLKIGALELCLLPVAVLRTVGRDRYSLPEPFEDARVLPDEIANQERSLADFRAEYPSFDVDLSESGQEIFRG